MRPAELFRRWFEEIWNNGRTDLIGEYLGKDCVLHSVDDKGALVGPDGFRPFYDRLRASFPDIRITIEQVIEQGDFAAGRWTAEATHAGEGMGCAPTNRKVQLSGMAIARFEDGKIAEAWDEWDRLRLGLQIGAVTPRQQSPG
jgi:steroid delta-isomerase-like uncharacterized protein